MAARIYDFPFDIGIDDSEEIITWTDEEIIKGYEENCQWEEDEFIYNQFLRQEKFEQRKRQECLVHKLVRKILSIFQ